MHVLRACMLLRYERPAHDSGYKQHDTGQVELGNTVLLLLSKLLACNSLLHKKDLLASHIYDVVHSRALDKAIPAAECMHLCATVIADWGAICIPTACSSSAAGTQVG